MWDSIKGVILDPSQPHGLNIDFLQNMIAEGAGTVIGITVSVMIAVHLDRQRENSRYRDQRGRAVTRWVKNHTDMVENLREEFAHGDGLPHRRRRAEIVEIAARDAQDIRDDYSSALEKWHIGTAFDVYMASLHALMAGLGDPTVPHQRVEERHAAATSALKDLVQKAGARRAILQTEPIFGEVSLRIPLHEGDDQIEQSTANLPILSRTVNRQRRAFR